MGGGRGSDECETHLELCHRLCVLATHAGYSIRGVLLALRQRRLQRGHLLVGRIHLVRQPSYLALVLLHLALRGFDVGPHRVKLRGQASLRLAQLRDLSAQLVFALAKHRARGLGAGTQGEGAAWWVYHSVHHPMRRVRTSSVATLCCKSATLAWSFWFMARCFFAEAVAFAVVMLIIVSSDGHFAMKASRALSSSNRAAFNALICGRSLSNFSCSPAHQ